VLDLNSQQIFERYRSPENAGTLEHPDLTLEGANAFCGDEVRLEVQLGVNGTIAEVRHQCRACAICTASADLLPELVIGKTLKQLQDIPTESVSELLGIPLSPTRLKCALLPLETLRSQVS
jgi:nitrogen fixation NifU-like protein